LTLQYRNVFGQKPWWLPYWSS